jgi:hypothetical protein
MRRVARENKIPYAEVLKIWRNQFEFAKEELEKYSKEELAAMSIEEQEDLTINFLYLGKVFMCDRTQDKGNKTNKLGEYDDSTIKQKKRSKE